MSRFVVTLSAKNNEEFFVKSYNIDSVDIPNEQGCIDDFQMMHPGYTQIKLISFREFTLSETLNYFH